MELKISNINKKRALIFNVKALRQMFKKPKYRSLSPFFLPCFPNPLPPFHRSGIPVSPVKIAALRLQLVYQM